MTSFSRTPISTPELVADLDRLGRDATAAHSSLVALLDGRLVPAAALPSLHASRKAAESLVLHLEASRKLVEEA
jgi:hypothetical protein